MLLKLYEKNNNPKDIEQIVQVLRDGGVVIYPTDTVYAIGCHALQVRAVENICRIKDIDPKKKSLSIICYDLSNISEYAKVENSTFKLMKKNLPGAFTLFLLPAVNFLRYSRTGKKSVFVCPIIILSARFADNWMHQS